MSDTTIEAGLAALRAQAAKLLAAAEDYASKAERGNADYRRKSAQVLFSGAECLRWPTEILDGTFERRIEGKGEVGE